MNTATTKPADLFAIAVSAVNAARRSPGDDMMALRARRAKIRFQSATGIAFVMPR